jgi:heme/copper-type cytochrome/quinol oxidase subunit 2
MSNGASSAGGASSTTVYSLFAVIAICAVVVGALLFIVHKHRQSNNVVAEKARGTSFPNPVYESQTADPESGYMQVDAPM